MSLITLRRSAVVAIAGLSALGLAACSSGQITQTSTQVAAVDGAAGNSADGYLSVRDVTVLVDGSGPAALKFTAINSDPALKGHELRAVRVGDTPVDLDGDLELGRNCSVVADSAAAIKEIDKGTTGGACLSYVETRLPNLGFAPGGNEQVTFEFDAATITVDAAVSAPVPEAGTHVLDPTGGKGEHSGHSHESDSHSHSESATSTAHSH